MSGAVQEETRLSARRAYCETIAHFATGVTVVTTATAYGRAGMTASAVASLSLDPLLLIVCLGSDLPAFRAIAERGRFAVNVLGEGQAAVALQFARPANDKFAGVATDESRGVPVLRDAIAHIVCDVHDVLPGGDHSIVVGAVDACASRRSARPLVYFKSCFGALRLPDDVTNWAAREAV